MLPFVKDFDSGVFNRKRNVNRPNTNFGPRSSFHSFQGQGGCSKVGHKIADCWYSTANENHNEIDVRSTFTIQSYVRIDRFGIDYQSVIDQSNQFIHLPIIQSFKSFILLYRSIHSTKIRNRKTDEIHKSAQSV